MEYDEILSLDIRHLWTELTRLRMNKKLLSRNQAREISANIQNLIKILHVYNDELEL